MAAQRLATEQDAYNKGRKAHQQVKNYALLHAHLLLGVHVEVIRVNE